MSVSDAGAALSVVATPLMVVRTGVTVATILPFGSTLTQGFNADAVTAKMKVRHAGRNVALASTYQLGEAQDLQKQSYSPAGLPKAITYSSMIFPTRASSGAIPSE